ncbi:MAG: tyrosine-type recombinase/integrase [Pseudomonadota bacterium]
MARRLHKLSAKAVEALRRSGYWGDGGGLYLQVSPARTKSWVFRYTLNGRSREMGLGSLNAVSLATARKKAEECRGLLADKIDPLEARRAARSAQALAAARSKTFDECAAAYIKAHGAGWKNEKHAAQWEATLETYCGPVFGTWPVADVDTSAVLNVLGPIWTEKTETATRLRARIASVLDWATVHGYRTGDNPARWRGHLDKLLAKIKKADRVRPHSALPYARIGAFMADLRDQEGTAARALEFTILTAARTGEVIGARPEEFDLDKGVWTVPGARMKAGREHRVPLSPRAVEIVEAQLAEGKAHVFPGQRKGKPLSNMAMLNLLKRMGHNDLTVHGFRSTFRDWAAECTAYPREVCEMALAHIISDKTEAAYRRGDLFEKRRRLMIDWAKFCKQRPAAKGTVTALRARG